MTPERDWARCAGLAESAVVERHLRRLWWLPGTALGVVAWPPLRRESLFLNWHYWWQAHLVDALVDAAVRDPAPQRRMRIAALLRGHRLRNFGQWTNNYYDDMAWLALAAQRAASSVYVNTSAMTAALEGQLLAAWVPHRGGGIPWRKQDEFFNAPANGPAGIALARSGHLERAVAMADWLDEHLRDPATGLIFDGMRADGTLETPTYTYCQGVVLGLETELAVRTGNAVHFNRVHTLTAAVQRHLCERDVVKSDGGGDGGLFAGVLVRYLALVACELPGASAADQYTRDTARDIVLASATSAWKHRIVVDDLPLFGADWTKTPQMPKKATSFDKYTGGAVTASSAPERDLSVQLSGWMLMEAAARVVNENPGTES